jgi:alkylation response protein AidB-like acyl-CoA dehydrogenase
MAMPLLLDEDTKMLRESTGRFFAEADTLKKLRVRRDARDLAAQARGEWDGMVALGLSGLLIPEAEGGSGLGAVAGCQVAEMMGRSLAAGPLLSSAVMAATAVMHGNNAALTARVLPEIASGLVVALACEETARHNPEALSTEAARMGSGFRLTGRKCAVIDGNIAVKLIVSARLDGTPTLFLVDAGATGVAIDAHMGVDSRPAVTVTLEDVHAGDVVGPGTLLDRIYDIGRLHLAAEMLGAAQEAFDRTIEYLKTRVQFGRPIGEFQALQHRAAILFGELEVARSVVLKATMAFDAGDAKSAELVSLAKARVGEIAKHATAEAIQLHGGIGMTDDFDLGFYLKRVRALAESLGDAAFHMERYARLRGL